MLEIDSKRWGENHSLGKGKSSAWRGSSAFSRGRVTLRLAPFHKHLICLGLLSTT